MSELSDVLSFFSKSAATDFFEDAEAAKNLSKVGKIVSFVNLGFIFYLTFIFGSNNQVYLTPYLVLISIMLSN